jgi:hypothetical protein
VDDGGVAAAAAGGRTTIFHFSTAIKLKVLRVLWCMELLYGIESGKRDFSLAISCKFNSTLHHKRL